MFGLGELALHGGAAVHQHFPSILQQLSSVMSAEESGRVVDQVVGALCRLVVANRGAVPLGEVVPVIMANLPLKEDKEEYQVGARLHPTDVASVNFSGGLL